MSNLKDLTYLIRFKPTTDNCNMEQKTTDLSWIFDDQYRIVHHLLFWIYIYLSDFLALFGLLEPDLYDWIFFTILVLDVAIVYLNLYVLIPQFLLKRKYLLYLLLTILSILINSCISFYIAFPWEEVSVEELESVYIDFIFGSFEATLSMVILAMTIKLLKIFAKNQLTIANLETTNLKTELTFLKNQINPHFLFNALNNIYVQTRKRPKEAPESVMLLSELLRYQLYDCSKDQVYLKNELDYLNNYLALERMRRVDARMKLTLVGTPNGKMIAPFLFIPFIENAVKHGLETVKDGFIDIHFDIAEDSLLFTIKNAKSNQESLQQDGGIGLVNVKRRLALLYPKQHHLKISEDAENYLVELRLMMNQK